MGIVPWTRSGRRLGPSFGCLRSGTRLAVTTTPVFRSQWATPERLPEAEKPPTTSFPPNPLRLKIRYFSGWKDGRFPLGLWNLLKIDLHLWHMNRHLTLHQ